METIKKSIHELKLGDKIYNPQRNREAASKYNWPDVFTVKEIDLKKGFVFFNEIAAYLEAQEFPIILQDTEEEREEPKSNSNGQFEIFN